jgi:hypothetical protein
MERPTTDPQLAVTFSHTNFSHAKFTDHAGACSFPAEPLRIA